MYVNIKGIFLCRAMKNLLRQSTSEINQGNLKSIFNSAQYKLYVRKSEKCVPMLGFEPTNFDASATPPRCQNWKRFKPFDHRTP